MGNLRKIKANLNLVNDGKDFEWIDGIVLRICSIDKTEYLVARQTALKAFEKDYRLKTIDTEKINNAIKECIAEHILVGWSGITDDDGNEVVYSKEQALEFFNDPELFEFYDYVVNQASDRANFRQEMNAIAAKN